ncbi:MAG: SAM-dependent DNA methyltransferase, partial [Waterburya sp.]
NTILDFEPKEEKAKTKTKIETIKQEIAQLQTEEKQQRDLAKEEQVKGDTIYWTIYNLDRKNPNSGQDFEHLPPEQLLADILEKDRRVAEIMNEINSIISEQ